MERLRSEVHNFFIERGFKFLGNNIYEKDDIKIEYDDFYSQIFKYYKDGVLLHVLKDDINIDDIKNIMRGIKIDKILDGNN